MPSDPARQFEFPADRALSGKRICMIVGMHLHRAGYHLTLARGGKRLGIGSADIYNACSVAGDQGDLHLRRQRRNEDLGSDTERTGSVSHRYAMVATGHRCVDAAAGKVVDSKR